MNHTQKHVLKNSNRTPKFNTARYQRPALNTILSQLQSSFFPTTHLHKMRFNIIFPPSLSVFQMACYQQVSHQGSVYECVSKSFRTGRLERELQMVQRSATMCRCIAILWVSLVSFTAITLCVASQRVFIAVDFVTDPVRKILNTPSYICVPHPI
jgi:hypothetical protein